MGLLLHRMKMNYAIMASAGAVVPTFAPEILLILFRQRVKSWDLCAQRKFLTFVREFVLGWCGGTKTWLLKPFMFQEVLNIILDWMRLFLLIGLCQRDPISLLTCFYVFFGILYFEIALFNYGVLRTRTDLAVHWKTLLMFPFYRTLCLIFRLYAVMENAINYSSWGRKGLKISEREENIQDMPPVPPVIDPDWHTIWLQVSCFNVALVCHPSSSYRIALLAPYIPTSRFSADTHILPLCCACRIRMRTRMTSSLSALRMSSSPICTLRMLLISAV